VPEWRPTLRQVLWTIRIAIVLGVLIAIGHSYGITLWDWIKLFCNDFLPIHLIHREFIAVCHVGIWASSWAF
jgi:hypothetical protein